MCLLPRSLSLGDICLNRFIPIVRPVLGALFSCALLVQGQSTYQYLNATVGPEIRYNDGVAGINGMPLTGQYSSGDTTACAWAADNNEYCVYTDAYGILPTTITFPQSGSNIGVYQMRFGSNQNLFEVNTLSDFGAAVSDAVPGRTWNDGLTWKTAGIAPYSGCLYMTIMRQSDAPPWNVVSNISMIKSCDGGAHWCNYLHATSSGCSSSSGTGDSPASGQAMWPGTQPFLGWVPVTYCQDNTINCPSVDNNSQYIYLVSLGNGSPSWSNYYLARVPKTQFPSLNVSNFQYWMGPLGGSVVYDGNWSPSISSATPIITNISGVRGQVYYLAAVGQYVLLQDNQHGAFDIWNAPSLAGFWRKSSQIVSDDEDATSPTIVMSSVKDLSTTPAVGVFLDAV